MNIIANYRGEWFEGTDPVDIVEKIRDYYARGWDGYESFNADEIQWFETQPITVVIKNIVEIYRK